MGEGVGGDLQLHRVADTTPLRPIHGPDESLVDLRLVLLRKRCEVVLAKNLIGRQLHGPDLEGLAHVPDQVTHERVGPDRVQNAIAVAASYARDPGIEVRGRQRDITHRDLRGEHPVERSRQGDGVEVIGVGVERHDLATSVHTPIGAPRTRHRDRRSQDFRQRLVEIVLHRAYIAVGGEPVERSTVVGDRHADAHLPIGRRGDGPGGHVVRLGRRPGRRRWACGENGEAPLQEGTLRSTF